MRCLFLRLLLFGLPVFLLTFTASDEAQAQCLSSGLPAEVHYCYGEDPFATSTALQFIREGDMCGAFWGASYSTESPFMPRINGITGSIIMCVERMITLSMFNENGDGYIKIVYESMEEAVWALIALLIVIHGTMMAMGLLQRTLAQTIIAILKVTIVLLVLDELPLLLPFFFDVMRELQTIVTGSLVPSPFTTCGSAVADPGGNAIWARVDCILAWIFGTGGAGVNAIGALTHILGYLFRPEMGIAVFLLALSAMVMLVLTIARAVFAFISAIIIVSFLVVLTPIFAPLIFFQRTKEYFDSWVRQLLSNMFQPMVLFAFLTLFFATIESVLFTGSRSLRTILNEGVPAAGSIIGDNYHALLAKMDSERQVVSMGAQVTGDEGVNRLTDAQRQGLITSLLGNIQVVNALSSALTSGGGDPSLVPVTINALTNGLSDIAVFNELMNQGAGSLERITHISEMFLALPYLITECGAGMTACLPPNFLSDLAYNAIVLILVCYLFYTMIQVVPQLSKELFRTLAVPGPAEIAPLPAERFVRGFPGQAAGRL